MALGRLNVVAGALALALSFVAPAYADAPLLSPMFQDHAVLQRDQPIAVWGVADAGDTVSVSLNGHTASARADRSGHWRTNLPALATGGPYTLTARTRGATQTISDVMLGDVFLCSGQSNMELPVAATLYGNFEAMRSANSMIRLLTVPKASAAAPQDHFSGPVSWSLAGPDSVKDFSGTCYYFARELAKTEHVALGLIHSSWGGSNIETWLSEPGLRAVGGFGPQMDLLDAYARNNDEGLRRLASTWVSWWHAKMPSGGEPWTDAAASQSWTPLPEPMRDWKTWGVPELANHNGMVWFRRVVQLTAAQAAQQASLSLGEIDEVDTTWVNGQPIGNSFGWSTERTYPVPEHLLHEGDNLIVVNVLSTWDMGGMYGPTDHMKLSFADGSSAPLGGSWTYQFVPESIGYPPRAPWESIGGMTSLYNGMIAPIGPYGLRGALWYQGETSAGNPRYQDLLTGLMHDWRTHFGANLPFLIVQLPNFGTRPAAPAASDWASLREAQRRAVAADPHAGLAVTIDIGLPDQLHPPDKQDIGKRLARAARHVVYGDAITPSGPTPASAHRQNNAVVVSFTNIDGALVAYSGAPVGFELCGADQASCRFVAATMQANAVTLDASSVGAATRVRFCWGDAPTCNLYDGAGLPAGPFEIPIQ